MTDFLQPEGGWFAPSDRLTPPPPTGRKPLFRALSGVARLMGRSEVPDVIALLGQYPRLFWPWLAFASRMMPYGKLPPVTREKLILRTAWHCRSRYEWGQHVEIGLRAGLTDTEIVAVARGPHGWAGDDDAAALDACDELCRDKRVSAPTWERLQARFSGEQLVELTLLVGHYEMLAGFLNTAGLALEPLIEAELQAFYRRVAGT
ncbi:alkylhydroperoxidase family enzyme [Fluviicoccus keumensis]|uniref:Alkylhydroperoxidase family enzyme n=1 Tax=Fluviicoccus keumensis TaxID=1435465 RepID=A0A4Q7YM94_9GAMM|nr:carboxymuconolactone decarboxylase family protein [Fluviicoccus keumensis]RZU38697.1 alkylhydroperoxidase family enzyme [Fluviicoccus keumensis]